MVHELLASRRPIEHGRVAESAERDEARAEAWALDPHAVPVPAAERKEVERDARALGVREDGVVGSQRRLTAATGHERHLSEQRGEPLDASV